MAIKARIRDDEAKTPNDIADLRRGLRELGPSIAASFAPVIANLQTTIINFLQATYSTTAQTTALISSRISTALAPYSTTAQTTSAINSKVANPGAISPTTVNASGALSGSSVNVSGGMSGDSGTFNSAVTSTGVYNLQLSSSYKAMYVDSGGRFGFAPSARRFKTNIVDAGLDVSKVIQVAVKHYEYIVEVAEHDRRAALDPDDPEYDADYPVQTMLGVIAEDLIALGLTDFVFYEADGVTPLGVRYEQLALATFPVLANQAARIGTLERQVQAINTKLGL